jgi:hypothetical protein
MSSVNFSEQDALVLYCLCWPGGEEGYTPSQINYIYDMVNRDSLYGHEMSRSLTRLVSSGVVLEKKNRFIATCYIVFQDRLEGLDISASLRFVMAYLKAYEPFSIERHVTLSDADVRYVEG